jgi:hypothetical protein
MVLVDSRGISRVPRYSGTCPASQQGFCLPGSHRLWPIVPDRSTNLLVGNSPALRPDRPSNPGVQAPRFGLFRVRSPLLAESLSCFLVLQVLRWFTSLSCLPPAYGFSGGFLAMTREGFPHSDIPGSKLVCSSPRLIAACHVLHRLLAPRHPPYALSSLTIRNFELTQWGLGVGASGLRRISPRPWALRPRPCCVSSFAHCVCVVGKLPFAGYSIVKDHEQTGGEYRARTGDLLVANQALSQLS